MSTTVAECIDFPRPTIWWLPGLDIICRASGITQQPSIGRITFEAACEHFRELLVDSIRLRMRSDVPVGTTLSGGVDSSTIASLLRSFYDGEHHAFTAQFDEAAYDESAVAADLADQLDLRHHRVRAEPRDFIGTLADIVHHLDGPTPSPAIFPLWNIMADMRRHVVVALGGAGRGRAARGLL